MVKMLEANQIICGDCLEVMKDWPDKCVDLVLTDPPYGLGDRLSDGGGKLKNSPFRVLYRKSKWDDIKPQNEAFDEIFRISSNQIICGGNYFGLPPTRGFVCWDKQQHLTTLSAVEYIWTSFDCPAKIFVGSSMNLNRQHPTQKPVNLIKWLINKFSKPTDLILDCYCGSGTACVAAKMLGRRYIGIDISEEYCEIARQRIRAVETGVPVKEQNKGQMALFNGKK